MEGCVHWLHHFILWHVLAMEDANLLNPSDEKDLFCLHYIFLPRIHHQSDNFRESYSHHIGFVVRETKALNSCGFKESLSWIWITQLPKELRQIMRRFQCSVCYPNWRWYWCTWYWLSTLWGTVTKTTLTQCRIVVTMAFLCICINEGIRACMLQ